MLDLLLAYESGERDVAGINDTAVRKAYWDAAEYARSMMSQMAAALTG